MMLHAPVLPVVFAFAPPPEGAPSLWAQLIPFVLILGIFYFVILMPMRRRQQKVATFQSGIKVGDKVITTSGLYGTVTKVADASVKLQIADRVVIEVARASVGGYQGQDPVVSDQGSL